MTTWPLVLAWALHQKWFWYESTPYKAGFIRGWREGLERAAEIAEDFWGQDENDPEKIDLCCVPGAVAEAILKEERQTWWQRKT